MDIENLNKSQIIFLTLLVSFVTSIATGIVTVSLMAQAPQGVTQTINRIVERTVEKVVTEPAKSVAAAVSNTSNNTPPKSVETTVVVKEENLAADTIAKAQDSIVKIVERDAPVTSFYARGVLISEKGEIATDRSVIDPNLGSDVIFPSGLRFPIKFRTGTPGDSVMIADPDFTGTTTPKFSHLSLADMSKLRLGQSVIRIGGKDRDAVATGVVSSITTSSFIETNVSSTVPGSILVNLFGEIVGITTGKSLSQGNVFYSGAKEVIEALSK